MSAPKRPGRFRIPAASNISPRTRSIHWGAGHAYARNVPTQYRDPFGHQAMAGAIGGAEAGAEVGTFVAGPAGTIIGGIVGAGVGVFIGIKVADGLWNLTKPIFNKSPHPPDVDYPGDDATQAPEGYGWRGQPGSKPGDKDGNYYNPKDQTSFRPDLDHGPPIDPHWDFRDPDGNWWRIFKDGRKVPCQ
jgi:Bacterial toxin 37